MRHLPHKDNCDFKTGEPFISRAERIVAHGKIRTRYVWMQKLITGNYTHHPLTHDESRRVVQVAEHPFPRFVLRPECAR